MMLRVTNPIIKITSDEVEFYTGPRSSCFLNRRHSNRIQWSLCADGVYVNEGLVKAYGLSYLDPEGNSHGDIFDFLWM